MCIRDRYYTAPCLPEPDPECHPVPDCRHGQSHIPPEQQQFPDIGQDVYKRQNWRQRKMSGGTVDNAVFFRGLLERLYEEAGKIY